MDTTTNHQDLEQDSSPPPHSPASIMSSSSSTTQGHRRHNLNSNNSNLAIPLNNQNELPPLLQPPPTDHHHYHHQHQHHHCSSTTPHSAFEAILAEPYHHSEGDSLHSAANSLYYAHSRNHSIQQSQDSHQSNSLNNSSHENTPSTSKLIKPNGRPKVNTLPPWAKSHDDDDLLFQPLPTPPTPALKPSSTPRSDHSGFFTQRTWPQSPQPLDQPLPDHSKTLTISKFPRYSVSNSTLVPDSPSTGHQWTITPDQVDNLRLNTHLQTSSTDRFHKRGSPQPSPATNAPGNAGPSSTRRSLYRAMTTPSPVFQRFRPLIMVNGQRKRMTEDSLNNPAEGAAAEDDDDHERDLEEGKQTPSSPAHQRLGHHQHPPDDRWWQFTLPTKYRRKVEEYLSRQSIGGVGQDDEDDEGRRIGQHSSLVSPRVEMVEIDEDRRKILALLKRHATPHGTRYSSIDSNDPHFDLHRYGALPGISPLYKPANQDHVLALESHHPPTDFPLSAFSRKMSLTPSQQQQMNDRSKSSRKLGQQNPQAVGFVESFDSSNDPHHHHHPHHSKKNPYLNSLQMTTTMTSHQDHRSRVARIGSYFMHHPTAPLVCRLLNLVLTAIALGLCATIHKAQVAGNVVGVLGASTVFLLVAAPLGLVHNLFAIYCEYFGAPIGIWSVSWKMFHTLSELVFVSLWSAGLALTMNDELRSPLRCQSPTITPLNQSTNGIPTELAARLTSIRASPDAVAQIVKITTDYQHSLYASAEVPNFANLSPQLVTRLCHLQASLVSIIFAGLALYTLVLVVSLFRIFIKVSRKY
ncbi:hypothetical protein PGTUg99_029298 [Puccinia graminis f. sp. tritici]|uniref:Uncharacterized protein n=1 Tax=Puccinia graminis f. sp. tritici TaxID=56615 RepID=A0A5B0MJF9_PUCGR|nr:hypothetical protein PGTUg99_029298 [Puccinia graminis f. sp. tritici]